MWKRNLKLAVHFSQSFFVIFFQVLSLIINKQTFNDSYYASCSDICTWKSLQLSYQLWKPFICSSRNSFFRIYSLRTSLSFDSSSLLIKWANLTILIFCVPTRTSLFAELFLWSPPRIFLYSESTIWPPPLIYPSENSFACTIPLSLIHHYSTPSFSSFILIIILILQQFLNVTQGILFLESNCQSALYPYVRLFPRTCFKYFEN
jgi:hypothetical protein